MKTLLILSILFLIGLEANSHQEMRNGTAVTQYRMGLHYKDPKSQNLKDAFRWMHKSALKGYAPAQYEFALMFHYGIGVRQNFELARLWFKRASENGEPRAKMVLYRFYAGKKAEPRNRKYHQYYTQNFRTIHQ